MNITPTQINDLQPNEVFVFGSNLDGDHAGGAARFAVLKFGAKMGQCNGLQGQSYAIPTLSHPGGTDDHKLPLETIQKYVNEFIQFAHKNPNLFFYVTPIGCGIAGFTEQEIAPMFKPCITMENVALPQSFVNIFDSSNETNDEHIHNIVQEAIEKIVNKKLF